MTSHARIAFAFTGAIIFASFCFSEIIYADIPSMERAALVALYDSTDGDNWTNNSGWKEGGLHTDGFALPGTEENWHGIGLDAAGTTVKTVNLSSNNLVGTIPSQLGDLSSLYDLRLNSNQLSGSIPAELGNLTGLNVLYLNSNQLDGSIPASLGSLSQLTKLYLSQNQLTGEIPSEIGSIAGLKELNLGSNQLTGNIPAALGGLVNLEYLYLYTNQLEGSIPWQLGNLSNLRYLFLSSNQLTGSIPPELGNCSSLINLALYENQLNGSIPSELGSLPTLQTLYLEKNQLEGSIPSELGGLSQLTNLSLYNNQLSGNIPPALGNLLALENLSLHDNNLDGSIPATLGNLSSLEGLSLYNNALTGTIPPELGNLSSLTRFYLYNNHIGGPIPESLGNLTSLTTLNLGRNKLSGAIPASLVNLTSLNSLNIDYNALYTDNVDLKNFLDAKDSEWADTQTVSPENVSAAYLSDTSIRVTWDPIFYKADSGAYEVMYGTVSGGPYGFSTATEDKFSSEETLTGLSENTGYFITVRTRTDPHIMNSNTVTSEASPEVYAATSSAGVSGVLNLSIGGHTDLSVTNATVSIDGIPYTTDTDGTGNFSLPNLAPGTYTLTVTAPDLVPVAQEFTLVEGQPLDLGKIDMSVFTQQEIDAAVVAAVEAWDIDGDGEIGLPDLIHWLQVQVGFRNSQ